MAPMTVHPGTVGANQPPPLEGYDLYTQDSVLVEAVRREGRPLGGSAARARQRPRRRAARVGRLANEHPPVLCTHDRYGERSDEVELHPAWHRLLELGVEAGLHALPWRESVPGAHVARGRPDSCCSARWRRASAARSR